MAYGYKEILEKWHRIHDKALDDLEEQICVKGRAKYRGAASAARIVQEAMDTIWRVEDRRDAKGDKAKPQEIHIHFKAAEPEDE